MSSNLFNDLKNVFFNNVDVIEVIDYDIRMKEISDFKINVFTDNSKHKLIKKYIKEKKIIYFTDTFFCCEDGLVLYGKENNGKFFSKGFYEFDKSIFIWFNEIEKSHPSLSKLIDRVINKDKYDKEELIKLKEEQRIKELKVSQINLLSELDKDGNGEVDVIEGNDFNLLLKKHQNRITEIDRSYIQQFVKISSHLKTKKNNIQLIFNSIKDTPNEETLNQYVEILKDDIHSYNLILFSSLNMIVSLVEDDMITFYELHEMFDNLNIFDSKHEKDISQKLTNIGYELRDLMYSIEEMGRNIENQIGELTYVTEQTNRALDNQLQSIDSSIRTNNLLTGINAYQTYKLKKK